jgi:hypothetical protein
MPDDSAAKRKSILKKDALSREETEGLLSASNSFPTPTVESSPAATAAAVAGSGGTSLADRRSSSSVRLGSCADLDVKLFPRFTEKQTSSTTHSIATIAAFDSDCDSTDDEDAVVGPCQQSDRNANSSSSSFTTASAGVPCCKVVLDNITLQQKGQQQPPSKDVRWTTAGTSGLSAFPPPPPYCAHWSTRLPARSTGGHHDNPQMTVLTDVLPTLPTIDNRRQKPLPSVATGSLLPPLLQPPPSSADRADGRMQLQAKNNANLDCAATTTMTDVNLNASTTAPVFNLDHSHGLGSRLSPVSFVDAHRLPRTAAGQQRKPAASMRSSTFCGVIGGGSMMREQLGSSADNPSRHTDDLGNHLQQQQQQHHRRQHRATTAADKVQTSKDTKDTTSFTGNLFSTLDFIDEFVE